MHYTCVLRNISIYFSKSHVNTVTNVEVIRQNVFSHARVMVIGVNMKEQNFDQQMRFSVSFPGGATSNQSI